MTTSTSILFRRSSALLLGIALGCSSPESNTPPAASAESVTSTESATTLDEASDPSVAPGVATEDAGINGSTNFTDLPEDYTGPVEVTIGEMRTSALANGNRSIDVSLACDKCSGPIYIICVQEPVDSPSAEECVANIIIDAPYNVTFENLPDEGSVHFRARWEETNALGKPVRAWTTSWTEAPAGEAGPITLSLN